MEDNLILEYFRLLQDRMFKGEELTPEEKIFMDAMYYLEYTETHNKSRSKSKQSKRIKETTAND